MHLLVYSKPACEFPERTINFQIKSSLIQVYTRQEYVLNDLLTILRWFTYDFEMMH